MTRIDTTLPKLPTGTVRPAGWYQSHGAFYCTHDGCGGEAEIPEGQPLYWAGRRGHVFCSEHGPARDDVVTQKLADARNEIKRLIAHSECNPQSLATADALLAIVVAVESLAKEIRRLTTPNSCTLDLNHPCDALGRTDDDEPIPCAECAESLKRHEAEGRHVKALYEAQRENVRFYREVGEP